MKKILFFIPRMGGGGAERVVANLANQFAQEGNGVLIYTPTDSQSFYELDSRVRIEGENLFVSKNKYFREFFLAINGIRMFFRYQKKLEMENPDVIISFLTETNLIALLNKRRSKKLIISERNDPTCYNVVIRNIIKVLYQRADVLVCQSQRVASFFNSENVKVIPNPINIEGFPEIYEGIREKEIVAVGRLAKQKNFELLISAYADLEDEWKEYVLKIYGDGPLREVLEKRIKELGLENRVFLMGSKKNVTTIYRKASLFVMSSDYEGYPNALVEAMALGLPVICTDFESGVARELIEGRDGKVVPVNDKNELTNAISWALSKSLQKKDFGRCNSFVRECLSLEKIAQEWMKSDTV